MTFIMFPSSHFSKRDHNAQQFCDYSFDMVSGSCGDIDSLLVTSSPST
jgi:hypothetical protein